MNIERQRSQRGFTMIEVLVVLVLVGFCAAVAGPWIQTIVRRERLRSAVREVYSIVLAGRMQAVRRNAQVIVKFDLAQHRVYSWADALPYNYVQDAGEDTLASFQVPPDVYFRQAPFGGLNSRSAVAFDGYAGNSGRVDMIVFQGDGTILPPQASGSRSPIKPATYTTTVPPGSINCDPPGGGQRCRGVYLSDSDATGDVANRNTFRISVDDFGSTGRASLLKWVPTSEGGNGGELNYVPSPWTWSSTQYP